MDSQPDPCRKTHVVKYRPYPILVMTTLRFHLPPENADRMTQDPVPPQQRGVSIKGTLHAESQRDYPLLQP